MAPLRRHCLTLSIAATLLLASGATAQPFSDLYVFGDSLSDVGNDDLFTVGFVPGPSYFEGRFSNGPVYSELLAEGLGLGPLVRSGSGGNGFAFGGAMTSGTPFPNSLVVDDLDDQIDDFLANRAVDSAALHVVFIGANDFFDGQTNVSIPTDRVATDLQRLANAGAEQFLVLNLPWLGLTPAFNGSVSTADEWNQRSQDFNAALETVLDNFESANALAEVFRVDVAGLLNNLVANADDRGFTNTTDSAAPGLEEGDLFYDESQIVENPDEYLFWDTVHPTAALHRLLGFEAVRAVLPEGDYNRDGAVTIDDYAVWRDAFGSTDIFSNDLFADGNSDGVVNAADYTVWRDNLPLALSTLRVPEPTSALLMLIAVGLFGTANATKSSARR